MAARLFLGLIRVMFCLFFFAKVGISDLNCGISSSGIPPPSHERIINGYNISTGDHPWLVSLFPKHNGTLRTVGWCGGTILSDRWILTAAHCTGKNGIADHRIFSGAVDYEDNKAKIVKIKRSINHPEFKRPKRNIDIALVELSEPLTFNDKIQPVCLVKKYKEVRHSMAVDCGWGSYSGGPPHGFEKLPSIAQETTVPLADVEECMRPDRPIHPPVKKEYDICAGALNRGTEGGDSGSPLLVNKDGRWWQIGVVSRGIYLGEDWHNVTGLTVYARVTKACQWIEETTSGEVKCHDMELY